jgi:hypothetical protein
LFFKARRASKGCFQKANLAGAAGFEFFFSDSF